jgi:hypothetical protein
VRRLAELAMIFALGLGLSYFGAPILRALPHEIYTGVHGRDGQLCCGADDCALTVYREAAGAFEFLTRENDWVRVPQERITFLPIPGDPPHEDGHAAHLCYRAAGQSDRESDAFAPEIATTTTGRALVVYCAFIPPGAT